MRNEVTILGRTFKIKLTAKRSMNGNYGETDGDAGIIKILKTLSPKEQKATLFHEMLHAALYVGGISFALDENLEEAVVRCIEHALTPHVVLKLEDE